MNFNKNIPEIEKKIGYTFKDKSLLCQAFTRSSFCNEHRVAGTKEYVSNEVLEFFGDSVLSTSIVSMMLREKTERYEHGIYTRLTEGDFSNIRSKLSDKRNLSRSMAVLGLQKYLRMGEGDSKLGVENEPSVMEDLFESIIGAVYIDCGMNMERVIKVVAGMLDVSVYFDTETPPIQSFKNSLQEWCADKKHRLPAPVYKTVSQSGPDHRRIYERAVIIGDRTVAVGKGKNLKIADAAAAEAALGILKGEEARESVKNENSLAKLKELAQKNKQLSPEFRDLGETPDSNERQREYIIECRCMGEACSGVGKSKQEAREIAAGKVLAALTPKTAPKQRAQKRVKVKGAPAPKAADAEGKRVVKRNTPNAKSARKGATASSPKKQPYQHKKHL